MRFECDDEENPYLGSKQNHRGLLPLVLSFQCLPWFLYLLKFKVQSSNSLISFPQNYVTHIVCKYKVLKSGKSLVWPIRTRSHTNKQFMLTGTFAFVFIDISCSHEGQWMAGIAVFKRNCVWNLHMRQDSHGLGVGGLPSHRNVTKNKEGSLVALFCLLLVLTQNTKVAFFIESVDFWVSSKISMILCIFEFEVSLLISNSLF